MPDKKNSRFTAQPGDFIVIKPGKSVPESAPGSPEKDTPKKLEGKQNKSN